MLRPNQSSSRIDPSQLYIGSSGPIDIDISYVSTLTNIYESLRLLLSTCHIPPHITILNPRRDVTTIDLKCAMKFNVNLNFTSFILS